MSQLIGNSKHLANFLMLIVLLISKTQLAATISCPYVHSVPKSSHMAGIYSDCSTREIIVNISTLHAAVWQTVTFNAVRYNQLVLNRTARETTVHTATCTPLQLTWQARWWWRCCCNSGNLLLFLLQYSPEATKSDGMAQTLVEIMRSSSSVYSTIYTVA